MIYHYFENKDVRFQRVLERAYGDLRSAERKLKLNPLSACDAGSLHLAPCASATGTKAEPASTGGTPKLAL